MGHCCECNGPQHGRSVARQFTGSSNAGADGGQRLSSIDRKWNEEPKPMVLPGRSGGNQSEGQKLLKGKENMETRSSVDMSRLGPSSIGTGFGGVYSIYVLYLFEANILLVT